MKHFHAKASSQKARNYIRGLFNVSEDWKEKEDDMAEIIRYYFSDIFASSSSSQGQMDSILESVRLRLPLTSRDSLDAMFTTEEIRLAIFQMSLLKAPREDDFLAYFY